MKAYVIYYKGSWMGGRAFVLANDLEEAIDLVKQENPQEFEEIRWEEFDPSTHSPLVLYNWDGEY